MNKRWNVLWAAGILLITLSGCSKTGDNSKSQEPSTSSDSVIAADFTEKVRDLGGKTIKLASFWGEWSGGDSATPEQQECAEAIEKIQKDYNCKIELITLKDTYQQDINTAVAAGLIYANLIQMQTEHASIFNSGNIANVNDIKNLNLSANKWNQIAAQATTRGNKQYGVGFNLRQQDSTNRMVLTFNKELAKQYQIEDLYSVVKKGEWTYDKFMQVSQDVVTKSNGAVYGLIDGYHCFGAMIHTNNIELVKDSEKSHVFNGSSEPVLTALQFLQNYNKAGLLNLKDYVGTDFGLSESNVFMSRKTFFHMSDYWVVSQVFSSGMPDDYGVLPLPKGPNAEKYVGVASNSRYFSFIKGDPDMEDAATVLVALANRTGITNQEWLDIQAETSLRDDESLEMLQIMLDNEISTVDQQLMPLEYSVATNEVIYEMSKTPKQAMDGIQQVVQAKINEYYK